MNSPASCVICKTQVIESFSEKQFLESMYIVVVVSSQLHCANLQSGYTTICDHPVKGAHYIFFLIISSGHLMHKKQCVLVSTGNTVKFRLANVIEPFTTVLQHLTENTKNVSVKIEQ